MGRGGGIGGGGGSGGSGSSRLTNILLFSIAARVSLMCLLLHDTQTVRNSKRSGSL